MSETCSVYFQLLIKNNTAQSCSLLVLYILQTYDARKLKYKIHLALFYQTTQHHNPCNCNITINRVFSHNIFQHFHYLLNYRVFFLMACCRTELTALRTTLRYVQHRLHCAAPFAEHDIKWKQIHAKWELLQYI